jgi:hypothetical protein
MKKNISEKDELSLENGLIQSLYYLYQELLKGNMQELAYIMEAAIQACEEIIRNKISISQEGEEILRSFYILQEFRQLNKKQKEAFVREIKRTQTEH